MNVAAQEAITTSRSLGGLLVVAGLGARSGLIGECIMEHDVMNDGIVFATEYIGDGWRVLVVMS